MGAYGEEVPDRKVDPNSTFDVLNLGSIKKLIVGFVY